MNLKPRDKVKLALQYQECDEVPWSLTLYPQQEEKLRCFYGETQWKEVFNPHVGTVSFLDGFLSEWGMERTPDGDERDCLGCVWKMGSTHHLVDWPLHEPSLGNFRFPELKPYIDAFLKPKWPERLKETEDQFRINYHVFGLFERAWTLRGFENLLCDLAENEKFVEELLDHITEWFLQSIDLLAGAPVDAIMFSDDHAGQRGMLMGAKRWRRLFKPRWKIIWDRVHHYGLYTFLHMCGDTSEVIPDLIESGLDCMESCQPECMDIFNLKREFGKDIRFWGGLGAQSTVPFGTAEEVRHRTRELKEKMGKGGGYILDMAKAPDENVPLDNIVAFVEEARTPRLVQIKETADHEFTTASQGSASAPAD